MNFTQLKSNFTNETKSEQDFEDNQENTGLTPGQIAGIVLGSIALIAIITACIIYNYYYRKGYVRK